MRSTYVYVKTRAAFGKQCIFNIQEAFTDEVVLPNPLLHENYILQNPCNKSAQVSKQFALHEVQTIGKSFKNNGMFHFEGGWPKEINPKDEETTARFKRRVEKEDNWAPRLRPLFEMAESCILQNSAVNVYEHYFDDMIPTKLVRPRYLRTVNVYADPQPNSRPVNNISWSPDSVAKMAVTHCYTEFGKGEDYGFESYIWEIGNSNKSWATLEPFCPAIVTEFNPRDPSVLASGLMTGQVCSWDLRTGNVPVQQSHLQFSHRSPASCLKWMHSKNNSEFFTGASDGRMMWWDIRKLREPTEVLIIDLDNTKDPKVENAIGVTSLNYEPSMGTKFLFGTENGVIVSGSRKSKTLTEKLALRFQGHFGPIYNIDRNFFNPKYILSVGDWTQRVWSEDTKEGNLVSTRFCENFPSGGCWSKSRYSIFYSINRRGELMAWDLLVGLNSPIVTMQLSENSLTTIVPHEEGTLMAVGDHSGNVYLVQASEALTNFEKNDRMNLTKYLDRCSRYMKTIDARLREIKLMKKDEIIEEPIDVEASKNKILEKPVKEGQTKTKQGEKDTEFEEVKAQYMQILQAEREKYELIGSDDAVQQKSIKIVESKLKQSSKYLGESTKSDEVKKDGKIDKFKEEEGEILKMKKRKRVDDKIKVPQNIIQEAEIIEVLEHEIDNQEIDTGVEEKTATKTHHKFQKALKDPKAVTLKLTKPCDSICDVKVCCKDMVSGKVQDKLDETTEDTEDNDEIDWSTVKKSPSVDLVLSKLDAMKTEETDEEISTVLHILSMSANAAKVKNQQTIAKSRVLMETSFDTENDEKSSITQD